MSFSEKMREYIKNAIIGILLLILICLFVIYILAFSGVSAYEFSKDDMEAVSSESVQYQYLDYWDISFASPSFIGFSAKAYGDNIGFYTLGGENADIYAEILPFLDQLLSRNGIVERLEEKKGLEMFHSLLKGDYIYLSYACDLPTSFILAMAKDDAVFDGYMGQYVSEILIVPEHHLWVAEMETASGYPQHRDCYSFYAVARDREGNYYRYSPSLMPTKQKDLTFHTNFYQTYNTSEQAMSYEFACLWKTDGFFEQYGFSEKVSDTTVISFDHSAYTAPIVFAETRIPNGADMDAVLEAFFMNPEMVSSYIDENGTVFYFDEGRNLSVSSSGKLAYTAPDVGGISLETLFGWHTSGHEYSIFDYLGASLVAGNQMQNAYTKTNCHRYISDISYDGSTLTISFGYASAGLPLYFNGNASVMSFSFSGGRIREAEYHFWTIHQTANMAGAPDFLWALRSYLLKSEQICDYIYGYHFSKNQTRCGMEIIEKPLP